MGFGLSQFITSMHSGIGIQRWQAKCWMLNSPTQQQQQHTQKCIKYEILIKFTEVNILPINILFKQNFLNYYFNSDPYLLIPLMKATLFFVWIMEGKSCVLLKYHAEQRKIRMMVLWLFDWIPVQFIWIFLAYSNGLFSVCFASSISTQKKSITHSIWWISSTKIYIR